MKKTYLIDARHRIIHRIAELFAMKPDELKTEIEKISSFRVLSPDHDELRHKMIVWCVQEELKTD